MNRLHTPGDLRWAEAQCPPSNRKPQGWCLAERFVLDIKIDALVAHACALTRTQYEVVLVAFEVLARVETAKHGHYQLESACLNAYARLG